MRAGEMAPRLGRSTCSSCRRVTRAYSPNHMSLHNSVTPGPGDPGPSRHQAYMWYTVMQSKHSKPKVINLKNKLRNLYENTFLSCITISDQMLRSLNVLSRSVVVCTSLRKEVCSVVCALIISNSRSSLVLIS